MKNRFQNLPFKTQPAALHIGPIPALQLLGEHYSIPTIMLWGVSVAYLGVFFAVGLCTLESS
jgi:hypothetical protein